VERRVERVLTRLVFPLSTCPKTPTLRFRIRDGSSFDSFSGDMVILDVGGSDDWSVMVIIMMESSFVQCRTSVDLVIFRTI